MCKPRKYLHIPEKNVHHVELICYLLIEPVPDHIIYVAYDGLKHFQNKALYMPTSVLRQTLLDNEHLVLQVDLIVGVSPPERNNSDQITPQLRPTICFSALSAIFPLAQNHPCALGK